MFDQAPVFLTLLWTYTLFVDSETGGNLGYMYIIGRLIYPFMYMFNHQFTMWFEWCTQMGYGVCGTYMLGVLMNGWDYKNGEGGFTKFGDDNPIVAPLCGFLVGSFGIFPYGNPLSCIYGWLHYKID